MREDKYVLKSPAQSVYIQNYESFICMSLLKTQHQTNTSYNTLGNCPNCESYIAKVAQLQNQLSELSNAFAQAVAQIKNSQKLKTRAIELDEQFIEQCVREKTDALAQVQNISLQSAQQIAKIKAESESKISQLTQQISQLRQQIFLSEQKLNEQNQKNTVQQQMVTQLKNQYQQKLQAFNAAFQQQQAALNEKINELQQANTQLSEQIQFQREQAAANKNDMENSYRQQFANLKKQFEQKVTQLNIQNTAVQQELIKTKAELAQSNEQIAVKTRMAARAEELNARLTEQCNMAKLGADTTVKETTKAFTIQYNKLKTEATDKLKTASEQNMKIKAAAQQTIQKAAERIRNLEQTINNLKTTASLIEPSLRSEEFSAFR